MDFRLTEQEAALKQEFEDFHKAEAEIAPAAFQGNSFEAQFDTDEGWAFHRGLQKKLAEKGWLTMSWPKEYGGRDAPLIEQLVFSEVHAHYRLPGIDSWGLNMFAPTVMLFGNDEQKERILPPIANGEVNYCQGWSEPDAGSDLASLKMSAVRKGDHYILNGQKIWTTGGHRADHMFLLARTDPTEKRNRGLSVFNIESMSAPGIEIRPILYLNGMHMYNEVFFTDVEVHERDRIGEENDGWASTRATMNFERSGVGRFIGLRRRLGELLDYAKETRRDGRPLIEDSLVRQKLAKLYVDIEVGRAMAYKIAWEQRKGNMAVSSTMASESKVFGTELGQRLATFATEIMGLNGLIEDSKWAPLHGAIIELHQSCVGDNIAAGSSEIQRNIIAWAGLGLPRLRFQT